MPRLFAHRYGLSIATIIWQAWARSDFERRKYMSHTRSRFMKCIAIFGLSCGLLLLGGCDEDHDESGRHGEKAPEEASPYERPSRYAPGRGVDARVLHDSMYEPRRVEGHILEGELARQVGPYVGRPALSAEEIEDRRARLEEIEREIELFPDHAPILKVEADQLKREVAAAESRTKPPSAAEAAPGPTEPMGPLQQIGPGPQLRAAEPSLSQNPPTRPDLEPQRVVVPPIQGLAPTAVSPGVTQTGENATTYKTPSGQSVTIPLSSTPDPSFTQINPAQPSGTLQNPPPPSQPPASLQAPSIINPSGPPMPSFNPPSFSR